MEQEPVVKYVTIHVVAVYERKMAKSSAHGYQDDGEHGAGYRLLNALKAINIQNMAVFIVRRYGGVHLGPQRHKIMEGVLNEVVMKCKI